jgi:hypothetical protein
VEALIGIMLLGTTLAGLLSGLTLIGGMARASREEAQATYVASETLDTLRLYSWNQLTNKAFLPPSFTVTYDANGLKWDYEQPGNQTTSNKKPLLGLLGGGKKLGSSLLGGSSNEDPNSAPQERTGDSPAYHQVVYHGTLDVSDAPVKEGYGKDIKVLTVTLAWESSGRTHEATMSTFFTRYGLQGQLVN